MDVFNYLIAVWGVWFFFKIEFILSLELILFKVKVYSNINYFIFNSLLIRINFIILKFYWINSFKINYFYCRIQRIQIVIKLKMWEKKIIFNSTIYNLKIVDLIIFLVNVYLKT